MDLYVVSNEKFVKVGISENFENRKKAYNGIMDFFVFHDLNDELAYYIETLTVEHFNGSSEYLYGVNFNQVVDFVKSKLDIKIFKKMFSTLDIEISSNSDGYYSLKNIVSYVNDIRKEKGKNDIYVADYLKLKETKDFIGLCKNKYSINPIIAKKGKGGGTYAIPEMVLDFLLWCDASVKYDVMNWMYRNKVEYSSFLNNINPIEPNKALNIAIKTAVGEQI